jgi:hypothetical protein
MLEPHLRIAVVFDISKNNVNGIRKIDLVKKYFFNICSKFDLNAKLFVAHSKNSDFGYNPGASSAMISNYKSEDVLLNNYFRLCLKVLSGQDDSFEKKMYIITDKFKQRDYESFKLPLILSNQLNQKIKFVYYGLDPSENGFLNLKNETFYTGELVCDYLNIKDLENKYE